MGTRSAWKSRMISPLDLVECEDSFCVCVDLPGLDKKSVSIVVQDNVLCISGSRLSDMPDGHDLRISERSFGKFERRLLLPRTADLAKIDASMKMGVLEIKIPKSMKEVKGADIVIR
ncbi:MAG: hypothetical protein SGCHY_004803 [Lobulomycetales sp.]